MITCIKCNKRKAFRRKGYHFDHEFMCGGCGHVWEPEERMARPIGRVKTVARHRLTIQTHHVRMETPWNERLFIQHKIFDEWVRWYVERYSRLAEHWRREENPNG